MELALAFSTAAGIFLIFYGIYQTLADAPSMDERLRRYANVTGTATRAARRISSDGRPRSRLVGQLDDVLRRRPAGGRLALQLERADVHLTPSEFVVLTVTVVAVCLAFGLLILRNPPFALMLTAGGFYAPRFWLWRKRQKRLKAFNDQLADGIALLASSLRSGYSFPQALDMLSRDGRPPLSQEFSRVNREVNLGLTPSDALDNMLLRVPSDDLDLFVTAVKINRDVGGNLAEVLDSIADTIRDRIKLFGEVRVLTAQQSYAGYVVTLLPVILAGVMFLMNSSYMMLLLTNVLGWIMLAMATFGIVGGFFAMRKIVNIRV